MKRHCVALLVLSAGCGNGNPSGTGDGASGPADIAAQAIADMAAAADSSAGTDAGSTSDGAADGGLAITLVSTIPLPGLAVGGAFDATAHRLYVGSVATDAASGKVTASAVSIIDVTTDMVLGTITLPLNQVPRGLAVHGADHHVYVATVPTGMTMDWGIIVIDGVTGQLTGAPSIRSVNSGAPPTALAIDGDTLYALTDRDDLFMHPAQLLVIDTKQGTITDTIPLPDANYHYSTPPYSAPFGGLAVNTVSHKIYVLTASLSARDAVYTVFDGVTHGALSANHYPLRPNAIFSEPSSTNVWFTTNDFTGGGPFTNTGVLYEEDPEMITLPNGYEPIGAMTSLSGITISVVNHCGPSAKTFRYYPSTRSLTEVSTSAAPMNDPFVFFAQYESLSGTELLVTYTIPPACSGQQGDLKPEVKHLRVQ